MGWCTCVSCHRPRLGLSHGVCEREFGEDEASPGPMKADPSVKYVSARDLARDCRRLLDEVERTGRKLMVLRHSHPVAVISPVGESARLSEVRAVLSAADLEESATLGAASPVDEGSAERRAEREKLVESASLSSEERAVLRVAGEKAWGLDGFLRRGVDLTVRQVAFALSNLEVKHLLHRLGAGYGLTAEGARMKVALAAIEDEAERND